MVKLCGSVYRPGTLYVRHSWRTSSLDLSKISLCYVDTTAWYTNRPLLSKHLRPKIEKGLQIGVNIVNYVKTRPLKARIFARSCKEMGAEHTSLIFYCERKWLSWKDILKWTFVLCSDLCQYLTEVIMTVLTCLVTMTSSWNWHI
jgi:hypothetical protein